MNHRTRQPALTAPLSRPPQPLTRSRAPICLLSAVLFFAGCATYRTCPDLSQVPPGRALPIDGLWRNSAGGTFRVEKGRIYTTKKMSDGLPPNRVISKDIKGAGKGRFTGSTESNNSAKRLSAFGPQSITIQSAASIRLTDGPNPQTGYKGGAATWTWSDLDDEQAFLIEFIEMPDAPPHEIASALQKVTDQKLLLNLARTAKNRIVRKAAVERVADEDALAQIAMADTDADIQKCAASRITSQMLLAKVAIDGRALYIQQYAAFRLTDQPLLAKVVREAKPWEVRKTAFTKIRDPAQLSALASASPDEPLRLAANVRLGKATWEAVLADATRNASKIGPAISAIAWADKQESLGVEITSLCHRYIRKGDATRIPELRELLRLYGTKPLAEDYLNCGQDDLEDAGRSWANSHGFNVGTGYGSHRVRWGEGR